MAEQRIPLLEKSSAVRDTGIHQNKYGSFEKGRKIWHGRVRLRAMERFTEEITRSLKRAMDQDLFIGLYVEPEDTKNSWVGQVRRMDETEVTIELYADSGMPNGFLCHLIEEIWRIDEMDNYLSSMAARAAVYPPSRDPVPDSMDNALEHAYQNGEVIGLCFPPEGYQPYIVLEMQPGRDGGWLRVCRIDPEDGTESRTSLVHFDDIRGVHLGTRMAKTLTRLRQGI